MAPSWVLKCLFAHVSGLLRLLWENGLGLPALFLVPVYHLKTLPSLLIKQITRSVHNFSVFFPTQTLLAI